MKNKTLILLILIFLSLNINAQTDSLLVDKKWSKSQLLTIEFGGKLEIYSVSYEYAIIKGKNNLGIGYGTNYLYQYINPKYGHTFYLNYKYGRKHSVFINLFQSLIINFGAFNEKEQPGAIWEQPLPFKKFSGVMIGYNYTPNDSRFSYFIGSQLNYYFGWKYNYEGEKIKYSKFSPWGSIGLKYQINKK